MSPIRTARLFQNGASQAVRLPAEFRFSGTEVFIFRDENTGDVILSQKPRLRDWDNFFALVNSADEAASYMEERPMNGIPPERCLFDERKGE